MTTAVTRLVSLCNFNDEEVLAVLSLSYQPVLLARIKVTVYSYSTVSWHHKYVGHI